MLKASFDYTVPSSLDEAVGLLARRRGEARVLAGGTDLVIALEKGEINPRLLVDIGRIADLQEIKIEGEFLSLGAGVSFSRLIGYPLAGRTLPILVQSASEIGSPQIRNRGTIGGNLGTASPAGDLLTPLVALEALVDLVGPEGSRRVPVDSFLSGGGPERIRPDEIIRRVLVPLPGAGESRGAFIKLGRRNALAISRLNLALQVELEGGKIQKARLAVGAAGPAPFRVEEAEAALAGRGARAEAVIEQVSRAVARSLGSRPSALYKTVAVKGLALDALEKCHLLLEGCLII